MRLLSKIVPAFVFATALSACGGGGGGETYDTASGQTGGSTDTATGNNSVTLTWNAPISRADGNTPMSPGEIDGYIIHYGKTSRQYDKSVNVIDGAAVSHTIKGLSDGTHYFSVVTYDVNGVESAYSSEASVTY